VSLFLGARFRIDAPNVLFRIGISSFFHHRCFTLVTWSATANAHQCSVFQDAGGGKCQLCHFLSYSDPGNRT
jgi:hypothetical protein